MRRFSGITFLVILALVICFPSLASASFANETLHYVITYKWGLIHKDTGEATLSLRNNGDRYSLILAARTKPWADRIFSVRDTLIGSVDRSSLHPMSYSKIAHEGGKYSRDNISFSRNGNHTAAKCVRIREKEGKRTTTTKNLSASGPAFDMLSVFYYLRTLDYKAMQMGHSVKVRIFSGSKVETLTISYCGTEPVKLRDKRKVDSYHIKFRFTTDGSRKSSDDINTWISTDSRHIPLLLEGSLPVGKVKCYYTKG